LKAWRWNHSGTGSFIRFTEKERLLLQYLETNRLITQSKFCKIALTSNREAGNILAAFVAIGMVSIVFTTSGVHYTLSDQCLNLTNEQRMETLRKFIR
jgi:TRAP-type uncharacterized transport system fused permease subunit